MNKKVKNWLRGMSSVVQVWPDTSSRIREILLRRSDSEALHGDWQRIGNDIRNATDKHAHEQKAA